MAKILQEAVAQFSEHMVGREYPACFTQKEFVGWQVLEREIPTQPIRGFACRDCTKEYQAEMRIANRCANPTINLDKIVD